MSNNPRLMACEEATWLAALIDGEGSFHMNGYTSIRCRIQMLNNPIIIKCLQITRCGTVWSSIQKGKRVWIWAVSPTYGKSIIEQISPYLIEKKEQAEIFIKWPVVSKGCRVPDYILKERAGLVSRLRYLNHSEHQHKPGYEYAPTRYCTMQATL